MGEAVLIAGLALYVPMSAVFMLCKKDRLDKGDKKAYSGGTETAEPGGTATWTPSA